MVRLSDSFHIWYEKNRMWENTTWMGIPCFKLPFDAWILQELIWTVRPDLIIETGTGKGGSALFYASMMELMKPRLTDEPRVITVDVNERIYEHFLKIPIHIYNSIEFLVGSSTDQDIVSTVREYAIYANNVMVVLDSWHSEEHVLKELELYSPFVTIGSYLIVEDTHVDGNPVPWNHGRGPMGAVNTFLESNSDFVPDRECEKLMFTFNPKGYLKRIK